MLRALPIPEPDPLCMLLRCKPILTKHKEEVPSRLSLDDNIQIHKERLVGRVLDTRHLLHGIWVVALSSSPEDPEFFVDTTITDHISTAWQLSCKFHTPLVWIWLELMLFADQVFFSLKVLEEWQRLPAFTPQTKLHLELLGQVFDEQMFSLISVRYVHFRYGAVRRITNSVYTVCECKYS